MAGHSMLPKHELIKHNGNRVRNAIHRAELLALWAEEAFELNEGDEGNTDANALANLANAWAQIATATAQSFGER